MVEWRWWQWRYLWSIPKGGDGENNAASADKNDHGGDGGGNDKYEVYDGASAVDDDNANNVIDGDDIGDNNGCSFDMVFLILLTLIMSHMSSFFCQQAHLSDMVTESGSAATNQSSGNFI